MLSRYYDISKGMEGSLFLFGARQTGKTTLLKQLFPSAIYIDLLDTKKLARFSRQPNLLYEMLKDKDSSTVVIIDEIQQVPLLLNEVHRLITDTGISFVLCGSSARKLRRKGYNTLGGRALPCHLYPFVSAEIPDFNLNKALLNGMLPSHYLAKDASLKLSAYIEYFSILTDTLVGYMVPAFTKVAKRKLIQAPRFYFFDVGIVNHLLHRKELVRGTPEYGHAFEHFIIQELVAYIGYTRNENQLSYWRTYTGLEVDAVIGNALIAIEIKSVEEVQTKHLKGLKAFRDEHPTCRLMIVSLDEFNRTIDGIESLHVLDFLRLLWQGGLF